MACDRTLKPRGRPREVENPVRVSVRIPATVYDQIDRGGASVPRFLRQAAISALKNRTPSHIGDNSRT